MDKKSLGLRLSLPAVLFVAALFGSAAPASAQIVLDQGDASAGEQAFRSCAGCHKLGDGARNAGGPVLNDLFGRVAGTYEGFRYGDDLIAAGAAGLVWDAQTITGFIQDPSGFLKAYLDDTGARSKMPVKVSNEDDRWNLAAYLATFSTPPAQ
ncbi:MAG TPA: c-type cytochrome [Devosia sp.]|nr:c-type cytochrome [Devosia sp.]